MHFVDKKTYPEYTEIVELLADFSKKEMPKWRTYKNKKPRRTPNGLWTDAKIREPLRNLFLECCGYCGERLYKNEKENKYRGQVEHFVPKSNQYAIDNDLVYNWDNYIWSCPSCNTDKGTYFDLDVMLFNPCDATDCSYIFFNADKGNYQLKKEIIDKKIIERYKKTFDEKLSLINEKMDNRKITLNQVDVFLNSIKKFQNLYKKRKVEKFLTNINKNKNKLIEYYKQASYKLLIKETVLEFNKKQKTNISLI